MDHPLSRSVSEIGGVHTVVYVPSHKDDKLLGLISATRKEIQPFTDKQIACCRSSRCSGHRDRLRGYEQRS
jgi:hypothetical protein